MKPLITERLVSTATVLAALLLHASAGMASSGYDISAYGGDWAVIHRDNRNSDFIPAEIPDHYQFAYTTVLPYHQTFNKPTISPDGHVYFTLRILKRDRIISAYVAYDKDTGERLYHIAGPLLDIHTTAANSLIDARGNHYLSDNRALMKFDPSGQLIWRTPIEGVQTSGPQFTPEGKVLLMTWNGYVYFIEPEDGSILFKRNVTPRRDYPDEGPSECFLFGDSTGCAYANTPAIDPYTNTIYQTFNPSEGDTAVHAYSFTENPPSIQLLWSNQTLKGGSASSVALSSDYKRLYVSDRDNHLLALDSRSGELLWKLDVGFTASNSATVSEGGYIIPGGGYTDENHKIVIVKDMQGSADIVFQDEQYTPASSVAAGLNDRFVMFGLHKQTKRLYLLVLDPDIGIVAANPWPEINQPDYLIGLSLDLEGRVYVNAWGRSSLTVFKPGGTPTN